MPKSLGFVTGFELYINLDHCSSPESRGHCASLNSCDIHMSFCLFMFLFFFCLQAEGEETEVEQQQLHYQQTGISHTCEAIIHRCLITNCLIFFRTCLYASCKWSQCCFYCVLLIFLHLYPIITVRQVTSTLLQHIYSSNNALTQYLLTHNHHHEAGGFLRIILSLSSCKVAATIVKLSSKYSTLFKVPLEVLFFPSYAIKVIPFACSNQQKNVLYFWKYIPDCEMRWNSEK